MIKEFIAKLESSFESKLVFILPLAIILTLSFPLVVSMVVVKKHIEEDFLNDQKSRFNHFIKAIPLTGNIDSCAEGFINHDLAYLIIKDPQGNTIFNQSFIEKKVTSQ